MQIFVRGLASGTKVYEVPSCSDVLCLKKLINALEGIPNACQGLVYAGRQLQDDRLLSDYGVSQDSTVHLVLRLRGGKGGFGALLRGQGRDGKTTTNFDACRDLQGRRLRHQRIEQKLQDWQGQAKDRELEKVAQQHIKELARQQKLEARNKVDMEQVQQAQRKAVENVQEAVQSALAAGEASTSHGKRKEPAAASEQERKPTAKKPRMLACLEEVDSDLSSEEEDDE
eukprot:CAMPEP_0202890250 /NCGR_PEP_ID=MMETSP1392-20130828/730_1 /ASSEMBLY_ACC=CAM_ASM_000868 /TAXON_ID=225041 /ORGANISM="Chlamydomonas chlamydogama, Strain SAG 11-48b" /LENGTH=227 /DNA_ID=CAMNT_0049573787 /DNA_START=90 /DNA_END=773 /DNA_ORIENTATION=-